MPFVQIIPRPLNEDAVRRYAPAAGGIYGLTNSREWIYIAAAADIRGALWEHLRALDSSPMLRRPSGFVFETCSPALMDGRRRELIREYAPVCNSSAERRQGPNALYPNRLHARS